MTSTCLANRAPALILALAALFAPALPAQAPTATDAPRYPASTALAEGVSPEALARLEALVQGFVDDGEVVGAELLVVKDGRSILHTVHGWRDRERELAMRPASVFCVRSMTKPVVGAAVRMLIEDGQLETGDRVATHLPSFDVEGQRDITIGQLLTHTSGLPMSMIMAQDPRALESVRAVADLGGGCELEFEPGTGFGYSDQGTDTLTAVIEVVTGAPAEEFVRARLLEPLGMASSTCLLAADDPLLERGCAKYAGSPGAWTPFWSPEDAPLFPIFLGSQGLYSTVEDYAALLELWLQRGRVDGQRLLRSSSVRKTLEPGPFPMQSSTGFPGLRTAYGSLMQLWTRPAGSGEDDEVVVFGHTGSDGTHAYAFPEQKAMVLYFTQSRGTATGLRVEEVLGELFLGAPYDPLEAAPPLEQYLGYYQEDEHDLYRAIVLDGEDLALEILGKAVVPLTYAGEDRWKLRPQPGTVLEFERDEHGAVVGYHIGDHRELRFTPADDLPGVEEVCDRVAGAHHLDALAGPATLRIDAGLALEQLGLEGLTTSWLAWPDRWRSDEAVGDDFGRLAFDGEQLWYASRAHPAGPMEGPQAALLRQENPFARFGDWRLWHERIEVIQRLQRDDEHAVLVRLGDTSAPAPTMYVDWDTGLVGRIDTMTYAEGLGRLGQRLSFGDYRDVAGAQLPHRTQVELANPMIGPIVVTIEQIELGVELPEGLFELDG